MHGPHIDAWTSARTTPWRVTTRHTMTLIHGAAARTIAAGARVRGDRPRKGRMTVDRAKEEETGRAVSKPIRNSGREQRDRAGAVSSFFSARPPSPGCFGCCIRRGREAHPPPLGAPNFSSQRRTEEIHGRDLVPFRNAERRVKINFARVSSRRYLRVGESRDVFTMKIARVARGEHHTVREQIWDSGVPPVVASYLREEK